MQIELAEKYQDTAIGREGQEVISPCVQCGQCTFVCPTFRLLDDEWDGPRGRIYLIQHLLEGKTPSADLLPPAYTITTLEGKTLAANLQMHLDRCLTCRSCEAACPEGVRFGRLLDIGRELVEREMPRSLMERAWRRALKTTLPHRSRFTAVLRTTQALRRFLPVGLRARIPTRRAAGHWPSQSHARTMVVWEGCVQPTLAPGINAAAARVLDRFGIRLIPAADGCCGALSQHMSAMRDARAHMRHNIDSLWPLFEAGAETLVLTASGCGAHFRDYGHLLRDDPNYSEKARRISELTRDIAEVVSEEWRNEEGPALSDHHKGRRIAYQSSCSLQHAQRLNGVVEELLNRAGYKLVRVSYPFMCCGSAGAYSILQRELSESLRKKKLNTLLSCRPQGIATSNIGCLNHLAEASPVPVNHWVELLEDSFLPAQMS